MIFTDQERFYSPSALINVEEAEKKSYFEENWKEYDSWYEEHQKEYYDQIGFIRKVLPGGKGLEIGVGTGRFASALGIQYGIDIVPAMVEMSRRRGVNAIVADAYDLPFGEKSFDYSLNMVTICFLENPEKALLEAKRVSSKVISVILDRNSEYVREISSRPRGFYRYARFYSRDELYEVYRKCGFQKISVNEEEFVTSDGRKYTLVAVTGE
jgi:ubiquinone/menaquinone biosynthesis C-methylase UbiE